MKSLTAVETTRASGIVGDVATVADPADEALIRARALGVLQEVRDGLRSVPPPPPPEELRRLMGWRSAGRSPTEKLGFYLEELALEPVPRQFDWSGGPPREQRQGFQVVIIGAGFGGLNAAIQLKDAGIPYTVVEKNAGVGGTWFQNSYPGFRVDVASRVYSYTFEADYDWEHSFAPRDEILRYIEYCADKYGGPATRSASIRRWSPPLGTRRLVCGRSSSGARMEERRPIPANGIISGVGLLDRPRLPDINGLESFRGHNVPHRALGPQLRLPGKAGRGDRGRGPSGMQLVPDVAPDAAALVVLSAFRGMGAARTRVSGPAARGDALALPARSRTM